MSTDGPTILAFSQSDAFYEILVWVKEKSPWKRDALRRIVENGELSATDFQDLEKICLDSETSYDPITDKHISTKTTANIPVSLNAVKSLEGVNALATNQSLSFSSSGLNIVYGDNGSGKSGYVRVLKKACRSRDANYEILPDINADTTKPPCATINYNTGSDTNECLWQKDGDPVPDLEAVSIFDSRSANTHVQSENNVAYIPFPMQAMQTLVLACDTLKQRLDDKITVIKDQTPATLTAHNLSPDSPAGNYLNALSYKSNLETLDLLADLSETEKQRLATLEADLAQDPKKAAAKLMALKVRLSAMTTTLSSLANFSSEAAANKLNELRASHSTLAAASKVASEKLFSTSPLPEIGGETWKALWEAARNYSDNTAYSGKSFPNLTADEDLCVLCQQPLRDEAIKRQISFEEFVKSTAKADEEKAKATLDAALDKLKQAQKDASFAEEIETLIRDELDDPTIAARVKTCASAAIERIAAMLSNEELEQTAILYPKDQIDALVFKLEKRIAQLGSDDSSPERKAIILECRNLKDRSRLSDLKADVTAEIARLAQIEKLKQALKTVSKRAITNKNKELSDKLVTDALRGRFAREVEKLKIGSIPLELKKIRDSNAQSIFRVEFVGLSGKPVGEVLSEGEHRCVALAAFLAELVTSQAYSAIVFDDPMSSLDHLYRQKVAKRLVEEAEHRQVIVFTHDLSFLFELKREAEAQETALHFQHVHRRSGKPGHIGNELPMKAKAAAPMGHAIQKELKETKGSFDNMSEAKRTIFVKGVLEQLREGWDQAIADFIQPVLGRFDSQIKGTSIYKLLDLTEADVKTITEARSRISEKMHTASESQNVVEISHEDLCSETKALLDWLEEFRKRPDKTVKPKISVLG